jgi:HicB_like antitoxin of bacterial toxin-antitoxin system
MAQEALELHVGMIEDGEELPAPSSLGVVMVDPEKGDAVAFLVTRPEPADRMARMNITLPKGLLRRIDERARNRSVFLARAAEKAPCGGLSEVNRKPWPLQGAPFEVGRARGCVAGAAKFDQGICPRRSCALAGRAGDRRISSPVM